MTTEPSARTAHLTLQADTTLATHIMAADAGVPAGAALQRPAGWLPQAVAVAIRDTVDGGVIPNVSWAVVEALTHTWTSKQLGTGGFGDVFKGRY